MIVNTNTLYSYDILTKDINALKRKYPFIRRDVIGYSVLGKPIYSLLIGQGEKQVFYFGSIHANEWITSPLLMKFVEDYSEAIVNDSNIYNYKAKEIFNNTTIYIVPMVNPDGVNLVTNNLKNNIALNHAKNISKNYPSIPFPSGWKANINGVDLNLQFPAGWNEARSIKFAQGFTTFAPRDFVGEGPLTEPESLAIYNYTLSHNFCLSLAFHTQGKEIYWQFQNYATLEAKAIGQKFADASGYTLAQVPYNSSFAGYKDWFLQNYRRPGYTIEAGLGTNPLPISQFNEIYGDILPILVLGTILS